MGTQAHKSISCLFCTSANTLFWHKHHSDADGKSYDIFKCKACGSGFVYPPPSEEYLESFYSSGLNPHGGSFDKHNMEFHFKKIVESESEYPNSTVDAERIVNFASEFAKGQDFLDIGAGYGFFTNAAQKRGFRCAALEVGENNCKIFRMMNGFSPINRPFDDNFVEENLDKYDIVLLSQVLEHLPNPRHAVNLIYRILKKDGLCIIAVPHFGSYISKIQNKKDMFIVPPEHINFFSIAGLNKLFSSESFDLLYSHTISRYDENKIKGKVKYTFLSNFIYKLLASFLSISDRLDKGMFINAYFRKVCSSANRGDGNGLV